jgi:uncharacterized protein YukE
MPPGHRPVNYDFAAAEHLTSVLRGAATHVEHLISARTTSRHSLLGEQGSDKWSGQARQAFDTQFSNQQRSLDELARRLRSAIGAVATATEQAHAASARP